jgi:hypothetical protein
VRLLPSPRVATESSSATSDGPPRPVGAELLVAGPVRSLIGTNRRVSSGGETARLAEMPLRRVLHHVESRRLDSRSGRREQSAQPHSAALPQRRVLLLPIRRQSGASGSVMFHSTFRTSFARPPRPATSPESSFASLTPPAPTTESDTPTHSRRFATSLRPPLARRRYVSCSASPTTGSVAGEMRSVSFVRSSSSPARLSSTRCSPTASAHLATTRR